MTLLELTIVIFALLGLISLLFIGAQAWKRGSDRTMCIMNILTVQKSLRSHANLYSYDTGETVTGLRAQLIGPGLYLETAPVCRGGGTYTYGEDHGENTIPPIGELYMKCSHAESHGHLPDRQEEW